MQNLILLFCFGSETQLLGKVGQKKQNCQFKLQFGTLTNPHTQNSLVMFTFSVLQRKNPFWANLVQNIKIFSLS